MKNTFITLFAIILLAVSPVAFAAECPLCDAAEDGNLSEVKILLEVRKWRGCKRDAE